MIDVELFCEIHLYLFETGSSPVGRGHCLENSWGLKTLEGSNPSASAIQFKVLWVRGLNQEFAKFPRPKKPPTVRICPGPPILIILR